MFMKQTVIPNKVEFTPRRNNILLRKGGVHQKPFKAIRKQFKQDLKNYE